MLAFAYEYHRQFNINLLALLLTTQEAVKHFPVTGGAIINTGSVITDLTPPASAVYSATKAAVRAEKHPRQCDQPGLHRHRRRAKRGHRGLGHR